MTGTQARVGVVEAELRGFSSGLLERLEVLEARLRALENQPSVTITGTTHTAEPMKVVTPPPFDPTPTLRQDGCDVRDRYGRAIASFSQISNSRDWADLIVRAVNAHADALKLARLWLAGGLTVTGGQADALARRILDAEPKS